MIVVDEVAGLVEMLVSSPGGEGVSGSARCGRVQEATMWLHQGGPDSLQCTLYHKL